MTDKKTSPLKSLFRKQLPEEPSEFSADGQGPPSFSETPSIDRKFLDRIRSLQSQGNPGLLKTVIGLYFQEAPKLLQVLREASDRDDKKGMQQAAHTLKSSSANLGASRVARICAEMEALARSEETAKTRTLVTLLENEYLRVRAALDAES